MPGPKVLVVDDHAIVREGVRALLEAKGEFDVVGEAGAASEAISQAGRLRPDFVLLDITLPDMSGLEAVAQIRAAAPEARVIILTMHEDREFFFRAIQVGAAGYVVKGGGSENILAALRAAQQGGVFLHPTLAKSLMGEYLRGEEASLVASLSARELEVLRLIGEGLANRDVAARLGISTTSAQTHRTRIMQKLGLHTAVELTRYAIRKGIIQP